MRKKQASPLEELLCGPLGQEGTEHLSKHAAVNILLEGIEHHFVVIKKTGRVSPGFVEDADFTVKLSNGALGHLLDVTRQEEAGLGELGVEILRGLLSKEADRKIELKIHSGPMLIWQRGYLSVAMAGGGPVMGFLAKHGLANMKQILAALKNMRSP